MKSKKGKLRIIDPMLFVFIILLFLILLLGLFSKINNVKDDIIKCKLYGVNENGEYCIDENSSVYNHYINVVNRFYADENCQDQLIHYTDLGNIGQVSMNQYVNLYFNTSEVKCISLGYYNYFTIQDEYGNEGYYDNMEDVFLYGIDYDKCKIKEKIPKEFEYINNTIIREIIPNNATYENGDYYRIDYSNCKNIRLKITFEK